jgi:DNA-binding response OmpR family regulator
MVLRHRESRVGSGGLRRKILIVEDEPSIRNILYVLLAGHGFEGLVAHDSAEALSMVRQDRFDAVLLDLRCPNLLPDQVLSAITELRPSLVGRVLVITGEVADPSVLAMLERHALPHVQQSRMVAELGDRLKSLLGMNPSPAKSAS